MNTTLSKKGLYLVPPTHHGGHVRVQSEGPHEVRRSKIVVGQHEFRIPGLVLIRGQKRAGGPRRLSGCFPLSRGQQVISFAAPPGPRSSCLKRKNGPHFKRALVRLGRIHACHDRDKDVGVFLGTTKIDTNLRHASGAGEQAGRTGGGGVTPTHPLAAGYRDTRDAAGVHLASHVIELRPRGVEGKRPRSV